jgi:hypothetical protein
VEVQVKVLEHDKLLVDRTNDEEGGRRRGTPARRGITCWYAVVRLRGAPQRHAWSGRDHAHAITDAGGAGDRMDVASFEPNVTRRGRAMPFRAFTGDDLLRFFTVCETAGMLG